MDNRAQSVEGGHSLQLHPDRPPPGPGCPQPPYSRGARPPNPPPCSRTAHLLKFPGEKKGLGVRHGQAYGLPTPAPVAPVPRTPLLIDRCSRGPCREGGTGGAALGVWGCKPPALERLRRGREAGGK